MATDEPEAQKKPRQEPPPLEFVKPGEPQAPLPPRDQPPAAWVPQPEEFLRPQSTLRRAPTPVPGPARFSRLAGIVLILAGTLGIAASVYQALNLPSVADYANFTLNNTAAYVAFNQICGLISIWSQVAALLGGVMALQRLNWRLTLVCAVFAILTQGFVLEASFLGVLGLALVVVARNEFAS
ncbi:MAG: DUF6264 family protein [Candidatus Thermoplasmatota archaeon]